MTTIRLILGDQLNPLHPWYQHVREDVVYVMMEVRQETDYVLHHAQKILAIFAAMRRFAEQLRERGHRVHHLAIDDPDHRPSLPDNLDAIMALHEARRFEYLAQDEWRLDEQLRENAQRPPIASGIVVSDHFYTARDEARQLDRMKPEVSAAISTNARTLLANLENIYPGAQT